MKQKLSAKYVHPDFRIWLERVIEVGCNYEVVIEGGEISRVYVREPDDGDWGNIDHGRIIGSKMLKFKQRVFMPRLINGNFIEDYNEKNQKRGRDRGSGTTGGSDSGATGANRESEEL